ncbi:MAG: iron ABC transporter permease, partial [Solirubrobacterales bacterium]
MLVAGILIGAAAVLPAAYLLVVVLDAPDAAADVLSSRTAALLGRTLGLAAAVTATGIAIAIPLAWLTARTDRPCRRVWATLLTLPLVIPSYVGAYLLVSAFGPRGFLQDALG